jgi:hypothetical protein
MFNISPVPAALAKRVNQGLFLGLRHVLALASAAPAHRRPTPPAEWRIRPVCRPRNVRCCIMRDWSPRAGLKTKKAPRLGANQDGTLCHTRGDGGECHERRLIVCCFYRAILPAAFSPKVRSSPHYGGEGVLIHPSHQGVCWRHKQAVGRRVLRLVAVWRRRGAPNCRANWRPCYQSFKCPAILRHSVA